MRIVRIISRILIGLLFIFSGFVKGVDPIGSQIKFIDYFRALGLDSLEPAALILAMILNAAEFLIGFCLFTGVRVKLASWGALLFMLFFTPLTLWLAVENPVSDCGCFGDAVTLSNWQTFYKNIFILAITLIIFIQRKKYKPYLSPIGQWSVAAGGLAIILGITYYCYNHLPFLDFRPYKVGTYIPDQMVLPEGVKGDEYMYMYTMNNTVSGETKEISSIDYIETKIWEDTTWQITETSEPILVESGYHPPIHDFTIVSRDGDDITDLVLKDEGYTFLLISHKLGKASQDNISAINTLANYANNNEMRFICMTASVDREIEKFKEETKAPYDFYLTDEITLETIIRANPGLVLLKNGTIIAKWHYNDIPTVEEFVKNYQSN